MRRAVLILLLASGAGLARAAGAEVSMHSELTPAVVAPADGEAGPQLILAQRVIDRSWGLPEGAPPPAPAPGLLSEGRALALSAAIPGAGQLYAGEASGILFALAEIAGWTSHWLFDRDARREREQADKFVGAPGDPASAWSYARWQQAHPGGDPSALAALYAGDKEAFYNLIVTDPGYLDGWSGPDPSVTRADFQHLRDLSNGSLDRVRASEKAIWLNHMVAAFDALRAARIHNLPIRRNLELRIESSWRRPGPTMTAALERRF